VPPAWAHVVARQAEDFGAWTASTMRTFYQRTTATCGSVALAVCGETSVRPPVRPQIARLQASKAGIFKREVADKDCATTVRSEWATHSSIVTEVYTRRWSTEDGRAMIRFTDWGDAWLLLVVMIHGGSATSYDSLGR